LEPEDWIRRWAERRIGFHRTTVQPWLVDHVRRLAPQGDECVLVPLCGKSVDLTWLEQRGHSVVGVDVAEQGLREFLAEQGRGAAEHSSPPFTVFATGRIELWCGDFFALDPRRHGDFPAILDRAALVAMEPRRRPDYARRLLSLLRPGGRLLLVGLEYDEAKMAGPPFSVTRSEVARHFAAACTIEPLGEKSLIDAEPNWRERGLEGIVEYALLLRRRRR
jgi:thiopurine S-methyltransferase